jgi:hypothetical protein
MHMDVHVLDLDGAITAQPEFVERFAPSVTPLNDWGPHIRIACSFARYRAFERSLNERLKGRDHDLFLYGSGDFHHVSLALLRRLRQPFNLLLLDKHPDWMRMIPVIHGGTWVWHALHLPHLKRVFHLGGDLDFDNLFRWLAPWQHIRDGRIVTIPAIRRYTRGQWRELSVTPLREEIGDGVTEDRLEMLLGRFRADLGRYPLYISLDKDVMWARDAIVNWDSGHLELDEVQTILRWFRAACGGRMAGMDVLGDWSPVRVRGGLRRALHWIEHPALNVDPQEASRVNGAINTALLESAVALSI